MISALESVEQGHGLLSFGEVARYLHVPPSTLRSWFKPYGGRKPILKSEIKFEDDGGLWLSFNDFIEAWVTAYLKSLGAKPKAVREALNRCESDWGMKYPLSRKGTNVWVDKSTGQVVIKRKEDKHPFEGTGKHRDQLTHYNLVQEWLNTRKGGAIGYHLRVGEHLIEKFNALKTAKETGDDFALTPY